MKTDKYDVIVIGGGSAGLMAAVVARESGARVLLIEKNKQLGEKLKISGGGRCNITNNTPDVRKFLTQYGENAKYLHSCFSEFSMKDTFDFFESRGLPLVTQARNRCFPETERALDVFKVFEREIKKLGVEGRVWGKRSRSSKIKNTYITKVGDIRLLLY